MEMQVLVFNCKEQNKRNQQIAYLGLAKNHHQSCCLTRNHPIMMLILSYLSSHCLCYLIAVVIAVNSITATAVTKIITIISSKHR